MSDLRDFSRIERFVAVLLMMACAAVALHEIANFFLWGHNGFNGSAFSQAARNTLRFSELGQAQYWTGPDAPPAEILYTHHPLLLHLHVALMFLIFGELEWAARLVPALYSILSAGMLLLLVKRYWGPRIALISLAVYATIPVQVIFANMIDHEQGGIFWSLAMLYFYLNWLTQRRLRSLFALFLATTMACQFDWPPYYLAFIIACHAALTGIAADRAGFRWRREYTFVAAFSAVVLTNFIGYFLWIIHAKGSIEQMLIAFALRTTTPDNVWSQILERLPLMIAPLSLALASAWLLGWLWRLGRSQHQHRDLVPIAFLIAQIIHHGAFKHASYMHIYWHYYSTPFIAIGAGVTIAWLAQNARVGLAHLLPERWRWSALGAYVAVLIALLTPLTVNGWERLNWGRSQGCAPDAFPGYTDYDRTRVAAWLAERTYFDEGILFHESFGFRAEIIWYIDRLFEHTSQPFANQRIRNYPIAFYVADTRWTPCSHLRPLLNGGYSLTLFEGHYLAADVREAKPQQRALRLQALPTTWWWWFFVNPRQPPTTWVDDPVGLSHLQWMSEACQ